MSYVRLARALACAFVLSLIPQAVVRATQDQPPARREEPRPQEPDKDKDKERILIIGVKGAGGAGTGAVNFDWDGPDDVAYGIYDHGCLPWLDEFNDLVSRGRPLIGSVTPAAKTWPAVLAAARAVLDDPEAKAGYTTVKEFASPARPDLFSAGAATSLMLGGGKAALAQLLAGVEQLPDDPDLLFNFAASLAQQQQPNESLAVIQRLRALDKRPALAFGVDADAALAYMIGYDEMLLGRLADAKTNFTRAIAAGPFLNEAKRALALVQAREGNTAQAQDTFLDGMWRFKPKALVSCGNSRDDDVRPPVDDMFDTSMGVEGRLVNVWLPDKAPDLLKAFPNMVGGLMQERASRLEPLQQRMTKMGDNPKFANFDTPYSAWANKMTELINDLDEHEPYVVAAKEAVERAYDQMTQTFGVEQSNLLQRVLPMALTPGNHCPTYRTMISTAINTVRPQAERYETAKREYARVWYKIATGLNAKIGDPEWHERNEVALRAELEGMNVDMVQALASVFAFPADLILDCPEDSSQGDMLGQPAGPRGSPCDQIFGDLKFKHSFDVPGRPDGPKIGYEVGCDKIKADIKYDLLSGKAGGFGTALGGVASIEIGRKGDYSVFAGARAEVSGPGVKAGIKSGLYLDGDNGGVTGFGGRVGLNAELGSGQVTKPVSDDMKFNLLPDPSKAPRGPGLKTFDPVR